MSRDWVKLVRMANGNSKWVNSQTALNMMKVRRYLKNRPLRDPGRSINKIAKACGMHFQQAAHAIDVLAYKVGPEVRLVAVRRVSPKGIGTAYEVRRISNSVTKLDENRKDKK